MIVAVTATTKKVVIVIERNLIIGNLLLWGNFFDYSLIFKTMKIEIAWNGKKC
ncbi:MAG: hypothetical protein ACD_56C00119G0010 [uncultured bacterium]|nr:MAG: hypothetical protein ACD_56C00119G0010 [uncultured bacterium]